VTVNASKKYCQIVVVLLVSGLIVSGGCSASRGRASLDPMVSHAVEYSRTQLLKSMEVLGDSVAFPRFTNPDGTWKTVPPRDWTSGFFPGSLWYMYELTGDPTFRKGAERWTAGLTGQQYLTTTHDVGFIMQCSSGNGYRLTSDTSYRPVLLQSARSLMTRYNPVVGCIRSWDNRKWGFPVIIDNMMNLELLFEASKNGGTREMYDIAFNHALTTMKNHFRPDGSTYHVVDYDTVTGRVVVKETHQGFAHESVWARGQAWAIYGFTMAYRETKHRGFLTTAMKAADWFVDHLPGDRIPYWDFLAPGIPDEARDASAAAIAASALFELSTFMNEPAKASEYRLSAENILRSLCSPPYLAEGTSSYGIINRATGNHPKNLEIDVSLIYGDYYFLETLARYRKASTHLLK
jgi:hypothetical protein